AIGARRRSVPARNRPQQRRWDWEEQSSSLLVFSYNPPLVWRIYRAAEVERRAAVGIVCGPKFSLMGGNNGTADGKAQPHSLPFRREERLEDLFHFFSPNAAPRSVGVY